MHVDMNAKDPAAYYFLFVLSFVFFLIPFNSTDERILSYTIGVIFLIVSGTSIVYIHNYNNRSLNSIV